MVLASKILSLGYSSYSKCRVHEETKCKLSTSHLTLLLSKCKSAHSFGDFEHLQTPQSYLMLSLKKLRWPIGSATGENGIDSAPRDSTSGGTRLARAIQDFQVKVDVRFKKFKENLPMKLLFFLVGFYCATAFATVIGQTGDWDILSAALAVVIVEGIGALMYRALPLINSLRNLIVMFNYWKAGLSLGLFLDSFKY
ncbi:hypothetical protein Leryth_014752 [Lithospermum erythrorhizon]|nr:hypothetical protein Leryth_014752 [Lithospermum erythrorhizon]